ncbi:MAG: TPM domain-containing protein [Acidobacteria bacterium]|nr:TPM domain-containing protein [Acidobacteriota bacterium]MBV9476129.1 TPM domain-containing protein [Acidobacteriota bacterium]
MLRALTCLLLAIALPPKPVQYVTDQAGVLDAQRRLALNEKLAQFERDTSDQILVYVERNLPPGTTLEELGADAIHTWGVGQKGKNNGAILFVFTDAHRLRIEVGYGLEGALTDAKSKEITSTVIKPLLAQGDYNGAVERGADAMVAAIRGEPYRGTGATVAEPERPREDDNGIPWGALLAIAGAIVAVGAFAWFMDWASDGSGNGSGDDDSRSSLWTSSTRSSSSDSSSSSSSSSDFSGGGGDGGGGGASDRW